MLLAPEDKTKPTSVPPAPTTTESTVKKWKQQVISGKKVFTARIGPTGGEKGYTAITGGFNLFIQKMLINNFKYSGQPSWGIAWYINDLLIPEIYVERGETYTFLVEGGTCILLLSCEHSISAELTGNDQTNSARYHPLYITDSFEGGFGQKTPEQQREQKVYAGVSFDAEGFPIPSAGET